MAVDDGLQGRAVTAVGRRGLLAATAGTALVGLAAGTVLHSLTSPPPAAPPEAAVHVTVADARLDLATTAARAVLDVTLVTALADVQVVSATVAGVGVAGPATIAEPTALPRGVDPSGHLATAQVVVPLHCTDADLADVSIPTMTLQLGHGATDATTTVTVAPTEWVLPAGLCQAVYPLLPQGWQQPAVLDSFVVDPQRPENATAVVSGLPTGNLLVTVAPLGFPMESRVDPHHDGTATIHLTIQGCPFGERPVAAGFALLAGADGIASTYRYVPVGLAMSRWQLAFATSLCP